MYFVTGEVQSASLAGFINSPHPLEARQPFGWWWAIMAGGHMNKQRRNAIDKLKCKLEDIFNELEAIAEEEREAFDSMPEGLQSSERGQKSDEAAGGLENAACELQAVIDALDDVTS